MRSLALLLTTLLLISACTTAASPQVVKPTVDPDRRFPVSAVPYPENYETEYVRYITVDRPDGKIRDIFVHPDILPRLRTGLSLPNGTVLVLETYDAVVDEDGNYIYDDNGRLVKGEIEPAIHVIEKRSNWEEMDFVEGLRVGNWNFGSFDVETHAPFDESLQACSNCHQVVLRSDGLFTLTQLYRFAQTGMEQYFLCDLPARSAC